MEYTHLGRTGLKVSRLCLGTMNFGPQTSEADSFAIMDQALDAGHQLLRHGQRLWLEDGRRRHRADHRALVCAGRRAARESRAGHQGLRRDGRVAQRVRACRRCHIKRPAKTACAACRPTTSTCTRCTTSTATRRGKRSGRRWSSWCARARCSTSAAATSPAGTSPRPTSAAAQRHFMGLVSEQSLYNLIGAHDRAGSHPGLRGVRPGADPVEPAGGRAAGRRAAKGRGGPPRR